MLEVLTFNLFYLCREESGWHQWCVGAATVGCDWLRGDQVRLQHCHVPPFNMLLIQ